MLLLIFSTLCICLSIQLPTHLFILSFFHHLLSFFFLKKAEIKLHVAVYPAVFCTGTYKEAYLA